MKKIILMLIIGMFLINLVSATDSVQQSLGIFKQNECINLKQICANCTYVNISSVVYPNSTKVIGMTVMTKIGTEYNISFCRTAPLGDYIVNGFGDPDGILTAWTYDLTVNPSGTTLTTAQGIIYTFLLILVVMAFAFAFLGAVALPFKNTRSDDNRYIIGVNDLKHLKVFLSVISYLLLMSVFGLARGIAANFIPEIGIYRIFGWMFSFMLSFVYPLIVMSLVLMIILFFQDKKLEKALERGALFQ